MISQNKNIIISMTDKHLGNFVMSLPSIYSLYNFYKNEQKTVKILLDNKYKDIALMFFNENELILFPRDKLKFNTKISLKSLYNFLKEFRDFKPDIIIDLEGRTTGPILSFISKANHKIGFRTAKKSCFYNIKISPHPYINKSEFYLAIPKTLGLSINYKLIPKIKNEWQKSLIDKLKIYKIDIENSKIVCIHPGAGKIYKKWPSQNFARIVDYLVKKNYTVILIGSSRDIEDVRNVLKEKKYKAFDLSNCLSLGELSALFSISKLYIGNDSGPLHLASLFLPSIGLFGHTNIERWKPLGKYCIVLKGKENCHKCEGKDCKQSFKCIKSINYEDVILSIEKIESDWKI